MNQYIDALPGTAMTTVKPRAEWVRPSNRLGDFSFRSPTDDFDVLDAERIDGSPVGLGERVRSTLAGRPSGTLAVGALPFEPASTASFGVGRRTDNPPAAHRHRAVGEGRPLLRDVCEEPPPDGYRRAVERAVELIERGDTLRKVVLARHVLLEFDRPVDSALVLAALAVSHPAALSFSVPLAEPAGTRLGWARAKSAGTFPDSGSAAAQPVRLVGASPELLLAKRGRHIRSVPLAGSIDRGPHRLGDHRARQSLTRSGKDLHEHAVVVEAIADTLAPFCRRLTVPSEPIPLAAGPMWHLASEITGELVDRSLTSLQLAQLLHPTPALAGAPRNTAIDVIGDLEVEERGFYGGVVGWCDAAGDGTWFVAIRCAEISAELVSAAAGAGIVRGSDPAAELAETTSKLGTVLAGLGLSVADLCQAGR